ncbi:tRNA 4-thiouridine(8) synthase ThiI [Pontibacillus yanchengensis]|uniref:tRNA 4-thiouridine(8) synthase ThiI n=2 Tax=Pontibacillus yanchengensis TaxID=462910 RepID=A0ACC7VE05_9BACI|nr:tRNA uracil 4-sulfurtransferase ThiI [Pontibacillus yanchengensis]MYL34105.1 tRNA 4-thiouridine(8) synthase ThiI [Pontibacillus yanchengensis]MYL53198.1 tRNA 4-thiouridine(8) synthase ThiI [Pontibacillus yanchengensis]
MQYDHILIRYGEMSLKGKNRKHFVAKLYENVKSKLQSFPDIKIKRNRDRMYILLNGEDPQPIMDQIKDVFGIQSFSLAVKVNSTEEEIKAGALFALTKPENVKTFKVSVRRVNKNFPINSQDMNRVIGGHLLRNTEGYQVDVHQPDMEIMVEIRRDGTYITSEKIKGAGGLPVGTTGKSLLLLSGGIDSPVAGYLTMKRGVEIEAIHFHSPPYTSERSKQKVLELAQKLTRFGNKVRVHIVPFTKLQQSLYRQIPEEYGMTVMRRLMLRISEHVAEREDILSFTTGESLGQVASQTMESMNAINEVTNYPIIRPLVAMDKLDIIELSKKIDTYEISIRPYEDCCTVFVPSQPKTRPTREKINELEAKVDFTQELEETLENIETLEFREEHSEQENEFSDLL